MDVKVNFNGTEKNKNEIIYNNIIGTMEDMNISKQEQIEYLKQKITYLESTSRDKTILIATILIGFIFLLFGTYLMSIDIKIYGAIFIIASFVAVVTKITSIM